MAAKPINQDLAEMIIADWRTGAFSQQKLADKHGVSKGVVNKLCKGVDQDVTAIVTAGIEYKSGLSAHDDRIVTAVTAVVDAKVRIKLAMERVIEKAMVKAEALMDSTESGADFKAIIDGIDKASVTVGINERHAKPTTIQNNQQNNINQYAQLSDEDLLREMQVINDRVTSII